MNYEEEMQDRANADSEFIDFEERCANCGSMYCHHETCFQHSQIGTWCPNGSGRVFALPEKDENL